MFPCPLSDQVFITEEHECLGTSFQIINTGSNHLGDTVLIIYLKTYPL